MINKLSKILSVTVFLIGVLVIIGWMIDSAVLKSVMPDYGSMKVNTALCFIFSGIALWLLNKKETLPAFGKIIASVLSILISVLGLLTIIEYKFDFKIGIDELLFNDNTFTNNYSAHGQMSPITAFNFVCLGIALLLLQNKKYYKAYQPLSLIVFSIGLTATIGYIYQIDWLTTLPSAAKTSLHTCLSFLMISTGILFTYPEKGLVDIFISDTISGKMIRILVPAYIIALLILGYLRLHFVSPDVRTGIAAYVYFNIICFIALIFVTTYFLNRSEKKEIEIKEQLASSEQKFRTLFEAAPDAVILINDKGIISGWNLMAENLFQWKTEEVKQKRITDLIVPQDYDTKQENGLEGYLRTFAETLINKPIERKALRKDGTEFDTSLSISPFNFDNETYFIVFARDITEEKENQEGIKAFVDQLSNQNKQLLTFAHIITHNLRTPVNNLSSLLFLYKELKSDEEKEKIFHSFETVTQRLSVTLNDLLENIKIKEDINKKGELLSFEKKLKNVKEMFEAEILESKAIITSDFSKAPNVTFPRTYLESIFLNLLSNALKYSSKERTPEIHFETNIVNEQIVFTVKDNGLGINLKKFGNKVFGLNQTFHRGIDSKGIGLFMTKSQVEAMGGTISVESEVNKGTTFIITFKKEV